MKLSWYARRLLRMSAKEVAGRFTDHVRKLRWRAYQVHPGEEQVPPSLLIDPVFQSELAGAIRDDVTDDALGRLLTAARLACEGKWPIFAGVWDTDRIDWFLDIRTGLRAPQSEYCFSIDHRDEGKVGNIKYVWEPSRHHMVTVLAAAYWLSGEEIFAEKALLILRSWWRENPFLSGVHWTSGIEIGIRLVSWTWTRRLLGAYPKVALAFEKSPEFLAQLFHHQQYLAAFRSRGTSANNHLIAEMAGLFVATCAFPWFSESEIWRRLSQATLEAELKRQTFPDGLNREQSSAYHAFVTEFFLISFLEGESAGYPFDSDSWSILRRSLDAAAAILDEKGNPPRQGDDDGAFSLLLDDPSFDRWGSLIETGRRLFGELDWWPQPGSSDVRSAVLSRLAPPRVATDSRSQIRPYNFPDAGLSILRSTIGPLWCRFDHGPHGYLAIASHAHADALSIELRVDGVPVLVDPGTFAYHGDDVWRSYFRSTFAHNTIEVAGQDQSVSGGPFLWLNHAVAHTEDSGPHRLIASHTGYHRLRPPVTHRRAVRMLEGGVLLVEDWLLGLGYSQAFSMMFHLGPAVNCQLNENEAMLSWSGSNAHFRLSRLLRWDLVKGQVNPPVGWYSPGFDELQPTFTLVGHGQGPLSEVLVSEFSIVETPLTPDAFANPPLARARRD
jgi:hypothetical protein